MNYTADFRFTGDFIESVYRSVALEQGEVAGRSRASVRLEGGRCLVLEVAAADIPALRAALNGWLRMINVAQEMQEIVTHG